MRGTARPADANCVVRRASARVRTAALERERYRPLYADPAGANTGSVRLLEKHGFQRTGTVRHGENEHVVFVLS